MKIIKEDIENLERYIGNSKVDVHAELPLVMADAFNDSRHQQELIDKEFKDADKETELEDKNNKVIGAEKQSVPKKPEEAKINLEESLFEDYRDKNWKLVELIQDYIRQGHIDKDEFIDKILQWYYMEPTFNSFLISNNIFSEDEMDELIEYHESLKEGRKASPFIDSEGNEYSDEDRSLDDMDDTFNDTWTIVYNEIAPENPNWKLKTKFPDIPTWKRYNQDHLEFDYDDNIIIHAEKEEDFDLAKRIADEYGLEFKGPRQRKFDKDFIATIIMPKEN